MSRIFILTPNYHPETNAGAKRMTAVAEFLAARGWRVTVLTLLPHHPQNAIYPGYDVAAPLRETHQGVSLIRLRPWIVPKDRLALRLLAETWFCAQSLAFLLSRPATLIYTSSPYMFLGPVGLLATRLKRGRMVWDVRDLTWLYPRSAGKRTFGLDRELERLMRYTAAHANGLTTATQGLLNYFPTHPPRALCLPNGVSRALLEELAPLVPRPETPLGTRVLYAGLFGFNHHLITLLEAAERLPELSFTLAGDGPELAALRRYAEARRLHHVRFTGYVNGDALRDLYAQHDLLVSHVRKDEIHRWAQPAKLWEYMATGRPVIHAGEGEAVEILQQYGLAVTLPPEDGTALAAAIQQLLARPTEARAMGLRGRAFVEASRSRERLLEGLERLLNSL